MAAIRTEIAIIGAGVIGNSIAYHLARVGRRVLVIERGEVASEPAASWASAGGVRRQGRHPAEALLAIEAIRRWRTLVLWFADVGPFLRQAPVRNFGNRHRVVRRIVEDGEPRMREVLEIDDVECARRLIEPVAILARIETEQRAEKKADRCFMRHDHDLLIAVILDDFEQRGQRARRHLQSALALDRRE